MTDSAMDTRSGEVDDRHSELNGMDDGTEANPGAGEPSASTDNKPGVHMSTATEGPEPTAADGDHDVDAECEEGNESGEDSRDAKSGARVLRGRGGNRGGNGRTGHLKQQRVRENIRSRFDNLEESSDQDEIRRQVEFYFSDSNLPIDPYLFKLVGGHANNFIPLKVITDFKRMRHFQPYSSVLEAVKQSRFLEVNDEEELRRREPLDSKFGDDLEENKKIQHGASLDKSIYVKGFGIESEKTQLEIEEFFQPFNARSVRLRRYPDNQFKGSVFVEFHDAEAQKEFLEHESQPLWNGEALEYMTKMAYVEMKHDGIVDGLVKPRSPTRNTRGRGRGQHNNDFRRSNEETGDGENWNKRRERDNGRDRNRGGNQRGRGSSRGRGGRGGRADRRGGRNNNSRDYHQEKANHAQATAEQTEGIAKRLSVPEATTETEKKRDRDIDDDGREGDAKKSKGEAAAVEE